VQASNLSSTFSLLEPGVSPARFPCCGRSLFSRRVVAAGSISAGASFYNKSCCVFVGASVKFDFLHPGSAGAAQSGSSTGICFRCLVVFVCVSCELKHRSRLSFFCDSSILQ
jgi:hypothetical protein